MNIVLKVEGMSCPHCSARLKTALEGVEGVTAAAVDHVAGTADVSFKAPANEAAIREAIDDAGFDVVG